MTCFCSFVGHDIFMRHFGDGVDNATEIDADSEGNDDDIEELDEHEEEIDEDEESEGEELASESDDDGSDDGCDSDDLGYGRSRGGRMRRGARGEGGHGKCREAAACVYNGPTRNEGTTLIP